MTPVGSDQVVLVLVGPVPPRPNRLCAGESLLGSAASLPTAPWTIGSIARPLQDW